MHKDRITIRLSSSQLLILNELKDTLGVNVSLLIRTIIGSWLKQYEDTLERIISGEQEYINPFENNELKEDEDDNKD